MDSYILDMLKSICLNFGFGKSFSSPVNLRFDDTNPEKESKEFINSIKEGYKVAWDLNGILNAMPLIISINYMSGQ